MKAFSRSSVRNEVVLNAGCFDGPATGGGEGELRVGIPGMVGGGLTGGEEGKVRKEREVVFPRGEGTEGCGCCCCCCKRC